MDFQLNEEQQMLKDSARRYLEAQCAFAQRGKDDRDGWSAIADMGWLGMSLPEDVGGLGAGVIESAVLMEELGRVLCVEPYWTVAMLTAQTVLASGDAGKAQLLLAPMIEGRERPVLAHIETAARGNVAHVGTNATAIDEGRWRLDGHKVAVVGGNLADQLIVSARTAGANGDQHGISLFLLDPKAPGVSVTAVRLIDNRWAADIGLDGVVVSDLLGEIDGAYPALLAGHEHGLLGLCAEALGVMEAALWITRDYLKVRQQFGVALSTFQSLQHRMSEMLIELELSRGMVHRAMAAMAGTAQQRAQALSAAKVHIGRSGHFVCGQAIQLHGGIGVTEEYVIGHYFKRMTCIEHALGNSHFHLEQLADLERAGAR
ncbi:MAG: acyl-CoA dehydrogenase family protein [Pseudomonadota bacterium]